MMPEKIIDVAATVVGVSPLERACRQVLVRGDTEQIFAPAVNPEMRGRRPSGVEFQAPDVPKDLQGAPILEEPPEIMVSKRSAKAVAEELTKQPVTCREQDGRCFVEVRYPGRAREFSGRTWFLALASLKNWLDNPQRQ